MGVWFLVVNTYFLLSFYHTEHLLNTVTVGTNDVSFVIDRILLVPWEMR